MRSRREPSARDQQVLQQVETIFDLAPDLSEPWTPATYSSRTAGFYCARCRSLAPAPTVNVSLSPRERERCAGCGSTICTAEATDSKGAMPS